MIEPLKLLVDALRQELQEYGEMLSRLDQQQDSIMRRDADDILAAVGSVQEQAGTLQRVRQERELKQRLLSRHFRQPEDTNLTNLIGRLHPDYRPLVRALMDENNELLVRVQQRARQNHLLLRRSLDLMQGLLDTLFPPGPRALYGEQGQPLATDRTVPVLCNAAA